MSATVAAALKKIAVAILTDKKLRKAVLGIALGIIIIVIMPVAAVIALFNGDINIDTDRLQQIVVEEMSDEEKAKLQAVEDTMKAIETAMTEKGFTAERTKEAQVLYTLALYDHSKADGFVDKLVGCFAEDQTDEQLIAAVNSAFGTELKAEDYSKIMNSIRANSIYTSGFTDPHSKNNLDLVEWAKQAQAHGWGYVWGSYGEVLTQKTLNSKAKQYPDEVGSKADFIKTHWLGRRTADCIGLIKGYGWLNTQTGAIEYGTNGMPDIGADTMFNNATEKGTIDTLPEIPGLALWHSGHIGIYIGGGKVIHAANTHAGVNISDVSGSGFTHWLKIPYITYTENTESQCKERSIWIKVKSSGLPTMPSGNAATIPRTATGRFPMTSSATASVQRSPTAMKTENFSKKNYGRERKSTSSS